MAELVDEHSKVSALKVQENVYRWEATNIFSSNDNSFISEAIPIANIERGTFHLCGVLFCDDFNSNKPIQLCLFFHLKDVEIVQIEKKCAPQISITGYNKNDVKKFNRIKNIKSTDLFETESANILSFMRLTFKNRMEYPDNILILEATVKQFYDDQNVSEKSMIMDIKSMYESKEFADFKIKVQNRVFSAHKFILCRSEVFRGMFRANMEKSKNNEADIEDVASEDFEELLLFMYTNNISSREKATLELAEAADKFGLIELQRLCEDYVEETIHLDNAISVFTYAESRNRDSLMKSAVDFIAKNKGKFNDADIEFLFVNPNFCEMLFKNNCK